MKLKKISRLRVAGNLANFPLLRLRVAENLAIFSLLRLKTNFKAEISFKAQEKFLWLRVEGNLGIFSLKKIYKSVSSGWILRFFCHFFEAESRGRETVASFSLLKARKRVIFQDFFQFFKFEN